MRLRLVSFSPSWRAAFTEVKGPGILAVSLSALAFYYFFLPPLFQLIREPSSYLRFAAFLGATMLIVWLMEAKRRIEESRGKIDAQYRTVADTAPDPIVLD